MFQQRHYEAIAKTLHQMKPSQSEIEVTNDAELIKWTYLDSYWRWTCHELHDMFLADNPRFKGDKFLVACGLLEIEG